MLSLSLYELSLLCIAFYAIILYKYFDKKDARKYFIVVAGIHLFIIQGLRAPHLGTDMLNYSNNYMYLKGASITRIFGSYFEEGYQALAYMFVNLGFEFQFFIGVISFLNIFSFSFLIYRYSKNPYLSVVSYMLLGVYDFSFSILRQSIAISIIALAFNYLNEEKIWKYLSMILVATTFHRTAIMFIIPYFIINNPKLNKLYKKVYIYILGIGVIFAPQIAKIATSIYDDSLNKYLNNPLLLGFGYDELIILSIFIMGVLVLKIDNHYKDDNLFMNLLTLSSMATIIQFVSIGSYAFARFNLFFILFLSLLIPYIYETITERVYELIVQYYSFNQSNHKVKYDRIVFVSLVILTLIYYHIYLQANPNSIVPHRFFWQN